MALTSYHRKSAIRTFWGLGPGDWGLATSLKYPNPNLLPFAHNQARAEKCWNVIKRLTGYARGETKKARKLLKAIYTDSKLECVS